MRGDEINRRDVAQHKADSRLVRDRQRAARHRDRLLARSRRHDRRRARLHRIHLWWRRRMDDPMAALLIYLGACLIVAAFFPFFGAGLLLGAALSPRSIRGCDK